MHMASASVITLSQVFSCIGFPNEHANVILLNTINTLVIVDHRHEESLNLKGCIIFIFKEYSISRLLGKNNNMMNC